MKISTKFIKTTLYILIVILPTQLGYHFWPTNTLVSGLKIDYLSVAIYLSDIVLVFYLLIFYLKFKANFIKKAVKITFPWVLFSLFQALFVVDFKIQSLYFLLKTLLLIFFISSLIKLKYDRQKIATIFSFQAIFITILSIWQLLGQKSIQGLFYFLGERRFSLYTPGIAKQELFGRSYLRPYATFSHPNVLAAYCLLIYLYIKNFFKPGSLNQKLLKISTQILLVLNLLLAFSQNTWLVLLILLLLELKTPLAKLKNTYKTVVASFSFNLLSPIILFLLGPILNLPEITLRNQLFSKIKSLGPGNWFFGIGFFDLFKISSAQLRQVQYLQPIHNLSWQIISALGLAGLISVFLSIRQSRGVRLKLNPQYLNIFLSIILLSSLDHYFLTSQQVLFLLAFLMADCFNSSHYQK